ncbi:MAG: putative lipid II flippase FtsW [Candidatus Kerfeldbacteria bacterium]|nr:putative lipid II flippase FtsW [Candidatus Kerfeldbacteria bacterium]
MEERRTIDTVLLGAVIGLVALGLIILSSATSVLGHERFGDANYFVRNQFIFGTILGGIAMVLLARIHYRLWKKFTMPFLVATIVLLVLVFIPGIGTSIGGAQRWLSIGGAFLVQPSEIAKLSLVLYLAYWLERRNRLIRSFAGGVLPYIVLVGFVATLILLQPDFGTMSLILLEAFALLFVAGARLRHLVALGTAGLLAVAVFIQIAPYRLARITAFLNPELDPQGIGYHINQALLAIGSGGLFGLGLGHSRQKVSFLPAVETDSIFAVYAEEFGFLLSLLLIALFLVVAIRGYRIARYAPDAFSRLVATGITTWFSFQALTNIATMVALLPVTGVPLPFVSYGRSAILASLAAVGILLNISRHIVLPERRFARPRRSR